MVDGEHITDHCCVVALAITADGTKVPVGLWEGSTENKRHCCIKRSPGELTVNSPAVRGRPAGATPRFGTKTASGR